MDFTLNEDQEELRNVARSFLESKCPTAEVRRLEKDEAGWSADIWTEMAQMGWVGLTLPDGGGDLVDLGIVVEELGRAVYPTPMFSTVVIGAMTLLDTGKLPAGVDEGTTLIGTALVDVPADALTAEVNGSSAKVSGTAPVAYDIEGASHVLVVAGEHLVLLEGGQSAISFKRLDSMSNDRIYSLILDGATGEVVGAASELLAPALARATAIRCAELVGVMSRALEMATEYVKTRVQFKQPLGAFQAIQHRLADSLIDLEAARLVAYRALWALTVDPTAEREVAVAKAWIAEACQRVAFSSQQVHGGIGVDMDYDLQLFFRRAKALEVELGCAPQHRERLAMTLGLR